MAHSLTIVVKSGGTISEAAGEGSWVLDGSRSEEFSADNGRFAQFWPLAWVAWLIVLGQPITSLLATTPRSLRLITILAALTLFVAIYLVTAWEMRRGHTSGGQLNGRQIVSTWLPIVLLAVISVVLTLSDGPRWLALFIYTSASAGGRLPTRLAIRAIVVLTPLTAALGWLSRDPLTDIIWATFLVAVVGSITTSFAWAIHMNRELRMAREENARLAVTAERLRFARDLHDILGHHLSLIALKSELAEYQVTAAPDQAVLAMREVGTVARTALQEVRSAVAGYRQPTLASEIRDAREILAAAGIRCAYEGESIDVPPTVEAVLAWAVREAVTNVIRHSRARQCSIQVRRQANQVAVEVTDDGRGLTAPATCLPTASLPHGNGLTGLAERVAALDGRYDVGPRPEGGFRLAISLPIRGTLTTNPPVTPSLTG